jgi:hypothetical protein
LGKVLAEYARHYNGRRPHRSHQLRRPGLTTPSPTSPRSGSSAGSSSAASSANMSGPRRSRSGPVAEFWNPTGTEPSAGACQPAGLSPASGRR